MLDYDLVTAKAAYRILRPEDLGAFVELVERARAEGRAGAPSTRSSTLATVKELARNKRSGSIFVIERGQDMVGFCIVINHWSSRLGGNVLCLDELYVAPEHRGLGIATDFIELMAKVAPGGSIALQLEPPSTSRKAAALCRRLRFAEPPTRAMVRPIGER